MAQLPIYLCHGRPGQVSMAQVKEDALGGIIRIYTGYDEVGITQYSTAFMSWLKKQKEAGTIPWPWVLPCKDPNKARWERIVKKFEIYSLDKYLTIWYAMDEPYNQGLWRPGMPPLTGDALRLWKIEQLKEAQRRIDEAFIIAPWCTPFVTADKPEPPGATPLTAPRLVRGYPLAYIEWAWEKWGEKWRAQFGLKETDTIIGYLIKPIFGKQPMPDGSGFTFTPEGAADFIKQQHLAGFLYYNATDSDVCNADGSPTAAMKALWAGMRG